MIGNIIGAVANRFPEGAESELLRSFLKILGAHVRLYTPMLDFMP